MKNASGTICSYRLDVLGCKVNRYDSRQIARLIEGCGLCCAAAGEPADLIVVHTCGVTSTAVSKSRQTLHRLQRSNPGAVFILSGCAAGEALFGSEDSIHARVEAGPGWIQNLANELQTFGLPNPDFRLPDHPDDLPAETFGEQARGYLKIQDGCDANCAYCIVPQLRKEPRDKEADAAVDEASAAVKQGCRELVVTGVHVGLYGRGTDRSLADILFRLASIPDLQRIRMSSLHPAELTEPLLSVWAASPNIMPHLHLSLQSGSDRVLRRMGRGYTAEEFAEAVMRARSALKRNLPGCENQKTASVPPAITTDVITGFPGETEQEFQETLDFCRQIGFSDMHIFTFSPRPGTRAAEMPDPVRPAAARERQRRLADAADEMNREFKKSFIGSSVNVLAEQYKKGSCSGWSEHYIKVRFRGGPSRLRSIVPVQITGVLPGGLSGETN